MFGSRSTNLLHAGLYSASVAALIGFSSICHAQSAVTEQVTAPGMSSPSITTCVACHGALGAGTASGGPRLAGKDPDYLAHALVMFKAGTRASVTMQAVARGLSDGDIRELSVFFSQQHPPLATGAQPPSEKLVMAGRQLAGMGAGAEIPATVPGLTSQVFPPLTLATCRTYSGQYMRELATTTAINSVI